MLSNSCCCHSHSRHLENMFRRSLPHLHPKNFYSHSKNPQPRRQVPSNGTASGTKSSPSTAGKKANNTFNAASSPAAQQENAKNSPPSPLQEQLNGIMSTLKQRFKVNQHVWAQILLPELKNEKFNQEIHNNGSAPSGAAGTKSTFRMKQKELRGERPSSVFRIPLSTRFLLIFSVLVLYVGRVIISLWDDTTQGKNLQEICKRLVKSHIITQHAAQLTAMDQEGEENDLIPQDFNALSRDEMVQLFRALNWYTIAHRSFTGFVEVGDTNPMVSTVLLNSKLYVWMLRMIAQQEFGGIQQQDASSLSQPESEQQQISPPKQQKNDFEFLIECTEALHRFAHDETVAKKIVEANGIPILRLVRQRLRNLQQNTPDKFYQLSSENKRMYSPEVAIEAIEDLLCEVVGFKWAHDAIQEADMKNLMNDLCTSHSSAEKLTKSLAGSSWTQFSSSSKRSLLSRFFSSNSQSSPSHTHLFEKYPDLKQHLSLQLQQHGYRDLSERLEKKSLANTSLHELWKYTTMHRDTMAYTMTAACGLIGTVAVTWFASSAHVKRRLLQGNFYDGYLFKHMNAYSVFVSSLVATHYVVCYPWILRLIRERVDNYKQDSQLIFKGSFLPMCVHNYKAFVSYLGLILIVTAATLHFASTASILLGSGFSMWLGLWMQNRSGGDGATAFVRQLEEELQQQVKACVTSPKRLLSGVLLQDEDSRHRLSRSEGKKMQKETSTLLKNLGKTQTENGSQLTAASVGRTDTL